MGGAWKKEVKTHAHFYALVYPPIGPRGGAGFPGGAAGEGGGVPLEHSVAQSASPSCWLPSTHHTLAARAVQYTSYRAGPHTSLLHTLFHAVTHRLG